MDDHVAFFARHPDAETRSRGLILCQLVKELREFNHKTAVPGEAPATFEETKLLAVKDALKMTKGNILQAAKRLNMARGTLYKQVYASQELMEFIKLLKS